MTHHFEDSAEAAFQAGLAYFLQDDIADAEPCFATAAKSGRADAQYHWAVCQLSGDGGPERLAAAVALLRLAAAQHHAAAQFELGNCLANGIGVAEPDMVGAAKWYTAAADKAHGMATSALADCFQRGTGVTCNLDRARELHQAALEQGVTPDRPLGYAECLSLFHDCKAASVGWLDGQEAQSRRFEALLRIGVRGDDSVLDLGCGVGHLLDYIRGDAAQPPVRLRAYTGVDSHASAVEAAAVRCGSFLQCSSELGRSEFEGPQQLTKVTWVSADAGEYLSSIRDASSDYDWVLCSGTFNLDFSEVSMWATIMAALRLANRGVAFNLLRQHLPNNSDAEDSCTFNEGYEVYEPDKVMLRVTEIADQISKERHASGAILEQLQESATYTTNSDGSYSDQQHSDQQADVSVLDGHEYGVEDDFTIHVKWVAVAPGVCEGEAAAN